MQGYSYFINNTNVGINNYLFIVPCLPTCSAKNHFSLFENNLKRNSYFNI